MELGKYSIGTGDRFGMQADAQLRAIMDAEEPGLDLTIVWNKSYREHSIIGSLPEDVRIAADKAVGKSKWKGSYFVDADHINLETVDSFIPSCDFFTIDVAEYIGQQAEPKDIEIFITRNKDFIGGLNIEGVSESASIDEDLLKDIANRYLKSVSKAKEIYTYIENRKGSDTFITEISMDEVSVAQTPVELFFILEMICHEDIPVSTIAPKFSGRFNKGVDYVGDTSSFSVEFEQDLLVLKEAKKLFGLKKTLKLSIHSGSDKFSIYPVISKLLFKYDCGIHIKTAGTTWLEEVIGLAISGKVGATFVKDLYASALDNINALCEPYSDVIDIDIQMLPSFDEVNSWSGERIADALRHNPLNKFYNPGMRQLVHIAYKFASDNIDQFRKLILSNKLIVYEQVYMNLSKRHLNPLFSGFNNL